MEALGSQCNVGLGCRAPERDAMGPTSACVSENVAFRARVVVSVPEFRHVVVLIYIYI